MCIDMYRRDERTEKENDSTGNEDRPVSDERVAEDWRFRDSFPGDPYCGYCGIGQRFSQRHGHMTNCPLATRPLKLSDLSDKELAEFNGREGMVG